MYIIYVYLYSYIEATQQFIEGAGGKKQLKHSPKCFEKVRHCTKKKLLKKIHPQKKYPNYTSFYSFWLSEDKEQKNYNNENVQDLMQRASYTSYNGKTMYNGRRR